jgi:hypothetical protein
MGGLATILKPVAGAEFLEAEAHTGAEGDSDWKNKVRVIAELRNDLPSPLLTVLQREFQFAAWRNTTDAACAICPRRVRQGSAYGSSRARF